MTAKEHSKLLGIFFLVQAGLQIFGGLLVTVVYGGLGGIMMANSRRTEDQTIGGIFIVMAVVVGLLVTALAALHLYTGWKLLKRKPGARILGIVSSCLSLLSFPLGTALGVYGLWFFFGDAGKNLDADNGEINNNYPPPPPHNWS